MLHVPAYRPRTGNGMVHISSYVCQQKNDIWFVINQRIFIQYIRSVEGKTESWREFVVYHSIIHPFQRAY